MNRRLFLTAALALAAAACDRGTSVAQPPAAAPPADPSAVPANPPEDPQNPLAITARDYMARNGRAEGVTTLPSGVQYKVLRSGAATGGRPSPQDEVKVHYSGSLTDGAVFDSSFSRGVPAVMPLDQLIPAWQEVLPLMRPGDDWIVTVPPAQGYGPEGRPPTIPPYSVLTFRLILLDFLPRTGNA